MTRRITLFVCVGCDRDTRRMETAGAEGRGFFRAVKALLKIEAPEVLVKGVNCMGGCACRSVEEANASCSVGLAGEGKFGYVLNRLVPEDTGKVLALVRAYMKRKDGMLTPRFGSVKAELSQHIATRLPPLE